MYVAHGSFPSLLLLTSNGKKRIDLMSNVATSILFAAQGSAIPGEGNVHPPNGQKGGRDAGRGGHFFGPVACLCRRR